MNNSLIKKFIVSILSITFLIQPLFQFFTGTNTVNAWEFTVFNEETQPVYNKETEYVYNCIKEYRYTVQLYGSQNGMKIWNSDMKGMDGSSCYINNSNINNRFTVNVVRKGSWHARVRSGHLLPQKRWENASVSLSATYVSNWTTLDTNDGRNVCGAINAIGYDGLINTQMKPVKEILKKEVRVTYKIAYIPSKDPKLINNNKNSNTNTNTKTNTNTNTTGNTSTSGSTSSSSQTTTKYKEEYKNIINNAVENNTYKKTTTTTTGSAVPSNITPVIDRSDLNDNARRLYIRNLYKRIFKREPSNSEIAGHFDKTTQKATCDIIFSQNNKKSIDAMNNEQFVEACYNYILGRSSDASGKASWLNYIASGHSREDVVNGFAGSPEFKRDNNLETTTLTFSSGMCTAVYDYLKNNGFAVIKPTETTIVMFKKNIENVKTIDLSGKGLTDLSGLKVFTNLSKLIVANNKIADLSKIQELTNLEQLYINNNNLKSLNGIEKLTKLKVLNIKSNNIINLGILAEMPALSEIYVDSANSDGTDVTLLNKEEKITLNDSVLAQKLKKEFGLSEVKEENDKYVVEIPRKAILKKKSLDLSADIDDTMQITDITGLEKFSQLTSINLRNNNISDFSKLSEIKTLETLDARNNRLTNFDSLKQLTNLKQLDVSDNNINNINGIENLTELQDLLLSNNNIGNNISKIAGLQNLTTVSLINNGITDISGLANLKVTNLFLDRNGISDISVLKSDNIEKYTMENNNIIINANNSIANIPEVIKKAMESDGGIENLEFTGCGISYNRVYLDDGIKMGQIKIKSGELRDTIVTIQDLEAMNAPQLNVSYELSSNKRTMTVTVTANKPIQNVLSWTKVDDNTIRKEYSYNVSNQNIVVRDLYGNETMQLIEFTGVKHPKIADLTVSYDKKMITNEDVTITLSSSENLAEYGNRWKLSDDKKSLSSVISSNTSSTYTTAIVYTESMFNAQMQPANIDIEVANIDKEKPVCSVEYDTIDLTKGAVKATIWANEEIEPVRINNSTKVVRVNASGNKEYGISLYYTANSNNIVTVRDLAYNMQSVNIAINNIDEKLSGLYSKTNSSNATNNGVKLTIGANEEIVVPNASSSTVVGSLKLKEYKKAKEVTLVANTVFLDSGNLGYATPVLRLADGNNSSQSTGASGSEVELDINENELGVLLAKDNANNKDFTLVNTSMVDKQEITVSREDVKNADGSVTVTLKTNKPILLTDEVADWNVSDDLQTLTKTFKENKDVELKLEDFAGNVTNVVVSVNNVEGFGYEVYYIPVEETNQVLVVIKSEKELQQLEGWELSEDKMQLGKVVGIDEKMSIKIYDIDGFSADVELSTEDEGVTGNETDSEDDTQAKGIIIDNTQFNGEIPNGGKFILFDIAVSLFLIGITMFVLIRYKKENFQ